ncbi:MAG: phage holin [Lachnospiraceae bacterium]|nr:phage holin [Lachnospiraceae bacterium]
MKEKISAGTIARTVLVFLALINQGLTIAGKSPIPVDDEAVTQFISYAFTAVTAVVAWWKNNSFTQKAIEADKVLHEEEG